MHESAEACVETAPLAEELPDLVEEIYARQAAAYVELLLPQIIDQGGLTAHVAPLLRGDMALAEAPSWIAEGLAADASLSWRGALEGHLRRSLDERRERVAEAISAQIQERLRGSSAPESGR